MTTIRTEDREILKKILKYGSRIGEDAVDLAFLVGCGASKLIAIAKRYEGVRFKGGTIHYSAPDRLVWSKATPGIANPNSGLCAPQRARISVVPSKRKAK